MKSKSIIITLVIINIILVGVIYNYIKRDLIVTDRYVIKEMSETELNKSISDLNIAHTDYANYIQSCKAKIATALTEQLVATSEDEKLEDMAVKIGQVLAARTADADAKAGNILNGKIAYIQGSRVTGTMPNNGAVTKTLKSGGSYTIPKGYHNGNGTVTVGEVSPKIETVFREIIQSHGGTPDHNGTGPKNSETYTVEDDNCYYEIVSVLTGLEDAKGWYYINGTGTALDGKNSKFGSLEKGDTIRVRANTSVEGGAYSYATIMLRVYRLYTE